MLDGLKNSLYSTVLKSNTLRKVSPTVGSAMLKAKQVSPDVYLIGGIAAAIVSGVMAAKAHKTSDYDFMEINWEIDQAQNALDEKEDTQKELVTPRERAELLAPLYGKKAGIAIRTYGPAVGMATLSVYLLLTSHGILKSRNKALFATVSLLEQGFSKYRGRVRDELGEDADERFLHGAEKRTITTSSEDADGKKKKNKEATNAIPEEYDPSMYTRIFDASSPEFSPDKAMNHFYLSANERYFNDILMIKGYVMLNDVYEALHIPQTPEGAVVGWSLKGPGDNFIDFGIDKPINKHIGDNRFVLDFNVNGVVFELIGQ